MSSKIHLNQQVLEKLESLLEGLEFGTVQITVHDSQITQIDRLERHRLPLQKKTNQVINHRKNER
ncbi:MULTISPECIES: YezD family protein [Neobacillus]|uniref:YezD family protein n=1 Tax=Neobacillus citreus TaxID=2833578 RepID=A0A942T7P9_9BACI|nr:YezD family protein [Neobacillus citreus]MCH6268043.1 YezD family protein [Neobacillus citreus]